MKKIFYILIILTISSSIKSNAQYSFSNMNNVINEEIQKEINKRDLEKFKQSKINNNQQLDTGNDTVDTFGNKNSTLSDPNDRFNYSRIGLETAYNKKGDKSLDTVKNVFLPARTAPQSIIFFEGQKNFTQFFQNNNVTYNPKIGNMTFNSEVINDYLGPIRIGVGFQISTNPSNGDSLSSEEIDKNKLISALQNSGGNVSINLRYPLLNLGLRNEVFGMKSYFYHNSGFDLSVINSPDEAFTLTNNSGIALGGYAIGYKKEISGFFEIKAAFLYGNKRFTQLLSPYQDIPRILPFVHLGFGIAFMDNYRIQFDIYPVGDYIKRNFPTTISFIITPKIKKD